MNQLYYGDNLDILRRYIQDETVDLVYLDPPFNSNATYNVLFAEHNGTKAAAQIQAFEDTWTWDEAAARSYQEAVEAGGQVAKALIAFGDDVPTPLSIVGNVGTAAAVADAIGYQILYFPLLTCWVQRPNESGSRGDASYRWELVAEEV